MHRKSVYFLIAPVLAMLALGIVMMSSVGAFAQQRHPDPLFFVKQQSLWLMLGALTCAGGAFLDYHFWQRTWWVWFVAASLLLALCFVPHVGHRINGSSRWVRIGPAQFQPSEIAKFAEVVFLAWWFARYQDKSRTFVFGLLLPAVAIGALMSLVAPEEDLGTTALLGGTMLVIMFAAGTSLFHLAPITLSGLGGIFYAATHMQERLGRLLAFMDLQKYKQSDGLQQWMALISFGSGGVDGLGLGNGRQKMLYLPYAHTDFIFPMIGEELGLYFTLGVVFSFLLFVLAGTMISLRARDRFGMLLGFGIVCLIATQAAVNIGMTTALLPNKGFALPFISYGGTNLVTCLFFVGILLNIYRQGIGEGREKVALKLHTHITPRF